MTKQPKTAEAVRKEFEAHGVVIADWARVRQLDYQTVVDVLLGRSKGIRGEAHRAAVALGLKLGRVVTAANFNPADGRSSAAKSKVAQ